MVPVLFIDAVPRFGWPRKSGVHLPNGLFYQLAARDGSGHPDSVRQAASFLREGALPASL